MKSLTDLLRVLVSELGDQCGVSTTRDLQKVARRVEHEGLSFLTITLPSFCSATQKWLSDGKVDRQDLPAFAWRSGLPLFLEGFLSRVFDRGTGVLLDEPDVDCLFAIRQITLLYSKILLPCSSSREKDAMSSYIECEKEVRESDAIRSDELRQEFIRSSVVLLGDLLSQVDGDVYHGNLVPKHGPGATADKLRGNAKFDQRAWTTRLEHVFPFGDYVLPSWRYSYLLDESDFLEPGKEIPVKVISVPKTLKTPRIIAVEPTCMQYMQQAVSETIVRGIEGSYLRSFIGFSDQEPNQLLALQGSIDGSLSTLDLSEASDRVSNQLVRDMCHFFPHLGEALDATRSRKADVPGHGVIRLAKFASMGSALCFPVEAMVFTTISFIGIARSLNTRLTPKLIKSFRGKVRVYGDDIIVPTEHANHVIAALEDFGLRVNSNKSFLRGNFRESCGKEYFEGNDVSVVKFRRMLPTGRDMSQEIVSAVSFRNQLYKRGLWATASYMDSLIEPLIGLYPVVSETSPVVGRHSFLGYETQRTHPTLHHPLVKGYVVASDAPRSSISGEGALLKFFLKRSDLPIHGNHLTHAGRPRSVRLRPRWATPF